MDYLVPKDLISVFSCCNTGSDDDNDSDPNFALCHIPSGQLIFH